MMTDDIMSLNSKLLKSASKTFWKMMPVFLLYMVKVPFDPQNQM